MKYVYIIMSGEGYGRPLAVCKSQKSATYHVNLTAMAVHNINPTTDPLDFDGALTRYGWADRIWWQKEVLYD